MNVLVSKHCSSSGYTVVCRTVKLWLQLTTTVKHFIRHIHISEMLLRYYITILIIGIKNDSL